MVWMVVARFLLCAMSSLGPTLIHGPILAVFHLVFNWSSLISIICFQINHNLVRAVLANIHNLSFLSYSAAYVG